jgi:hypothetical protein
MTIFCSCKKLSCSIVFLKKSSCKTTFCNFKVRFYVLAKIIAKNKSYHSNKVPVAAAIIAKRILSLSFTMSFI